MKNIQRYQKKIDKYLESKQYSWAPSTLKKAGYSLHKHGWRVFEQKPEEAYVTLRDEIQPYTLRTVFVYLAGLATYCGKEAYKDYIEFPKTHANLFKNAYSNKAELLSERTSKLLHDTDVDPDVAMVVDTLINTGMRISEVYTYSNGYVIGKGGKMRKVYGEVKLPAVLPSYHKVYRALKARGFKPHDLRKIFLTRLLQGGIDIHDVAHIAGHSSIQTTMRYLIPSTDEALTIKVKDIKDNVSE